MQLQINLYTTHRIGIIQMNFKLNLTIYYIINNNIYIYIYIYNIYIGERWVMWPLGVSRKL